MSERYSRLFALPKYLYTNDAPVVITAGALLKDNETGSILAQLKIRNIGYKIIKAVTIQLKTFDSAGRLFPEVVTKQYLDLNAGRESEFGQKTAVPVGNPAVRSFQAAVTEVVFSDKSVWQGDDTEWVLLDILPSLAACLDDNELVKQYRIKFGADCKYYPAEDGEIWTCTCGAFNHISEPTCHNCKRSYKELFSVSLEKLILERDARIVAEKKQAETEQKIAVRKREKSQSIAVITLTSVVILGVIFGTIYYYISKNNAYNLAINAIEKGEYSEAIDILEEVTPFKESENLLLEAKYGNAVRYLSYQEYSKALEAFTELGEYQDSKEMILEVKYQQALDILNAISQSSVLSDWEDSKKEYNSAKDLFTEIGNYKDSVEQLAQIETILYENKVINSSAFRKIKSIYSTTSFDVENNLISIHLKNDNWTEAMFTGLDVYTNNDMAYNLLHEFTFVNTESDACKQIMKQGGYPNIDIKIKLSRPLNNGDLSLVYSSLNGEQIEGEIAFDELEQHVNKIQEEAYNSLTEAVTKGAYAEAESLYQNEYQGYLPLEYKDVSNYYNYASIMNKYLGQEYVILSEFRKELNSEIPDDFMDNDRYRLHLNRIENSFNGKYEKVYGSTIHYWDILYSNADLGWRTSDDLYGHTVNVDYTVYYKLKDNELVNIKIASSLSLNSPYYIITPVQIDGEKITAFEVVYSEYDNTFNGIYYRVDD